MMESTTKPCRYKIAGVKFDLIDYSQAYKKTLHWIEHDEHRLITFTNPHCVMMCARSPEGIGRATQKAGLTLPDGVGIILAAHLLGYPHRGRVTGPAFMLKTCDWGRSAGLRHFFYGGAEKVAERLAKHLTHLYPGMAVAGHFSPPFHPLSSMEKSSILKMINASQPDIVWVGLGAPKQECWMLENLGRVNAPVMIGVGAAFDFHSGTRPWSPAWARRLGVEWAFRLFLEPRRMWRRNLDSPHFIGKVLVQCLDNFISGEHLLRRGKKRDETA